MIKTIMRSGIVYLDEAILVINKPPGLSLATPRKDPGGAVTRILDSLPSPAREKAGLSERSLYLLHRLDVGTSGLVVLARGLDIHRILAQELAEHRIKKTYLALVWGHPNPKTGRYAEPLGPDRKDRRRMKVDADRRASLSIYRTIAEVPYVSLLELSPDTGRTHQLRVHLSHAGHCIVGDDLYGGPRHRAVRDAATRAMLSPSHTFLHAWRLTLPETRLTRNLQFEAPLPPLFRKALTGLGIELDRV
jgi:23S rRNA pseudouridine1911/1915/1917 synthase